MNKNELKLLYQKDTGRSGKEIELGFERIRGTFIDERGKDEEAHPIDKWAADEQTEKDVDLNTWGKSANAWFNMPDPDYVVWLEEKIMDLLSNV